MMLILSQSTQVTRRYFPSSVLSVVLLLLSHQRTPLQVADKSGDKKIVEFLKKVVSI